MKENVRDFSLVGELLREELLSRVRLPSLILGLTVAEIEAELLELGNETEISLLSDKLFDDDTSRELVWYEKVIDREGDNEVVVLPLIVSLHSRLVLAEREVVEDVERL